MNNVFIFGNYLDFVDQVENISFPFLLGQVSKFFDFQKCYFYKKNTQKAEDRSERKSKDSTGIKYTSSER